MNQLSMPLDSTIPQEVAVTARQAGGRTLGSDSPLWQTLFPSKELRIDGRVPVEKSAQYLTQVRLNPSKELIAVAFSSMPSMDSAGFNALKSHLLSKGLVSLNASLQFGVLMTFYRRHGLIFPWGHNPKSSAPGRELYVVPLLSADPIPEYMELLDELQLPKERSTDYLVGIWVLTKGKLAPPPQPIQAASAAGAPRPSSTAPVLPNIDFSQLQHLNALKNIPPLVPSTIPVVPQVHPQISPAGAMSPPSAPPPNPTPDVSALTPEQITRMLQALSKASSQSPSSSVPIAGVPAASQPIALPTAALQTWAPQAPYPPPAYPQPPPPYPVNVPPASQSPPHGNARFDQRPYQSHPNNGFEYDRGHRGRGGRGRGGGDRGRGRDQGWPKRGRGGPPPTGPRNRGGSGGWGGEQQQRWS